MLTTDHASTVLSEQPDSIGSGGRLRYAHRMPRISSKLTYVYKHVMPWTLVVYAVVIALVFLLTDIGPKMVPRVLIAALGAIGCLGGFFFISFFTRNVVDEVSDNGDLLHVRNAGAEFRIPLQDCINVNYVPHISPPQISIMLRPNCEYGESLVFMPPVQFNPFAESPFVRDLTLRIDAARQQQTDIPHEPVADPS